VAQQSPVPDRAVSDRRAEGDRRGAGLREVVAPPPTGAAADDALLAELLATRTLRTVFQPLVRLDTREVVGYEALARGPVGSTLERPDLLFAVARRARRLTELDVACRVAAVQAAREAGLGAPYRLFLNAEPEALDGWRPDDHADIPVTVVMELTERALTSRPAQLLRTVARVRANGWGVALDDVGADPASLALLPLVRPDVIKLDLALVQHRPSSHIAAVMNALLAEAERSGTVVLAEGIETEEHLRTARALGATLGQGWLFGRPEPLPSPIPAFSGRPVPVMRSIEPEPTASPFDLAAARLPARPADKRLLVEVSKHLETQARLAGESAVVLSTFQDERFFTPLSRKRYADLAASVAFVAAIGEGMPFEPAPGVRGAVLDGTDPLRGEWDIAVLAPHFAATLVARDLGDTGPDAGRRFEFVLSHDRDLTVEVARCLMARISAEPRVADLPKIPTSSPMLSAPAVAGRGPTAGRGAMPGVAPEVSAALLGRALDAVTAGLSIVDVVTTGQPLIWVNEAFCDLTGYAPDELLGRNSRLLQGPRTDPRTVAEIGAAVTAGRQVRARLLNYTADGSPWWNELHLDPVADENGRVTHYIGVSNDVTARVEAEERVMHLAYHDSLTGLPNRVRLAELVNERLTRDRAQGSATALLFVDLDDFKQVNDDHGHGVGDELLRRVADRLRNALRGDDVLARQGGDEFLVLLSDLPPATADQIVARTASRLLDAVETLPISPATGGARVGASIGSSVAPRDGTTASELLRQADAAMYLAKQAGRHRHIRFTAA
jgi:diguanylate cyclase (GGDEF)-like protein/PAS domain S-box-containing protein